MTFTAADAARQEVVLKKRAVRQPAKVLRASGARVKATATRTRSGGRGRGSYTSRSVVPAYLLKMGRGAGAGADAYDQQKSGARLLATNMLGRTARERAATWAADAAARPTVRSDRLSMSSSRPVGCDLPDQKWVELARWWLSKIGAAGCKFTVHKRSDTPHPHIHVVFSRVRPDGGLVSDSWGRLTWRDALRRAEAQLGMPSELPRPADRPPAPCDRAVAAQRRAERRGTKLAGVDPAEVRVALDGARDLGQFGRALQAPGIEMQIARRADGIARGLLLRASGSRDFLAVTSIDREFSLPTIQTRIASAPAPTVARARPPQLPHPPAWRHRRGNAMGRPLIPTHQKAERKSAPSQHSTSISNRWNRRPSCCGWPSWSSPRRR